MTQDDLERLRSKLTGLPDRTEIAEKLFLQRQPPFSWKDSEDADSESDAGTLRSIAYDDADAVLALFAPVLPALIAAAEETATLRAQLEAAREALKPFANLAAPKTYRDAPGEEGPSQLDIVEGVHGTGELYLATHFGTRNEITLWRSDFTQALATLSETEHG